MMKQMMARNMTEISELLNGAITSIIDTKEESDIDSLFSGRWNLSAVCQIFLVWTILN